MLQFDFDLIFSGTFFGHVFRTLAPGVAAKDCKKKISKLPCRSNQPKGDCMAKKAKAGRPKGTGKKISGKGCRTKGHSFERWVSEQLRKVFPDAKRHLEYQAREADGRDIDNTGSYLFQCKRNRKYASLSKIKEVQIDPIEGGVPVLVTKGDNEEPLACLPFSHFVKLLAIEKARK